MRRKVRDLRDIRFFCLLFLFALLVRGAYAWRIRDLPTQHALVMDARRYDELAQGMIHAGRDGWMPRAVFYQAPLYPYALAAVYAVYPPTGDSRAAVRVLQALTGAATAVLLAVVAARLFGAAAGRAAGVLAALYGPFVFYAPLLLKTTLTLFAEAVFLLLLVPPREPLTPDPSPSALPPPGRGAPPPALGWFRLLLAGAVLGIAVLLQENLLLLAPFTALFILTRAAAWRRRLVSVLAFAAGTALALAPVTLLNYRLGGEVVLTSSQGGMNFYIGNARGASGTYSGLGGGSQDPLQQEADAQRLAAGFATREAGGPVDPSSLTPGQVSALFRRETVRQIRAAPGAWARLLAWKTRLFWNAYEIPDAEGYRVYRGLAGAVTWPWLGFGPVAALGLAGLVLAWRGPRPSSPVPIRVNLDVGEGLAPSRVGGGCEGDDGTFPPSREGASPSPTGEKEPNPLPKFSPLPGTGRVGDGRGAGGEVSRSGALLLALLAAGVCLSVVLFFVFGRYRLPVVPFLIPSAGFAVVAVADLIRRRARRELACAAAALGLLLLAIEIPAYTAAERNGHDAAVWFNLSSAALRWAEEENAAFQSSLAGAHLERAIALTGEAADDLSRAVADNPGFLLAHVQRAVALHRRGVYLASGGALEPALAAYGAARRELTSLSATLAQSQELPEAAAQAREILAAIDANCARALTNLGARRIQSGDLSGAETALRQAVALDPASAAAFGNLGLCLLAKGEREASREAFRRALDLAGPAARPEEMAFYRRGLEMAGGAL